MIINYWIMNGMGIYTFLASYLFFLFNHSLSLVVLHLMSVFFFFFFFFDSDRSMEGIHEFCYT